MNATGPRAGVRVIVILRARGSGVESCCEDEERWQKTHTNPETLRSTQGPVSDWGAVLETKREGEGACVRRRWRARRADVNPTGPHHVCRDSVDGDGRRHESRAPPELAQR